ncbi:MAG: DUF2975 domain-containing protein [Parafilimonas terrae]|nr:DUF2975 domain-containing protein [Parafilimonas terrae]
MPAPRPVSYPTLSRLGRGLSWLLTVALTLTVMFACVVLACGLVGAGLWLAPGRAILSAAPPDMPGVVPFRALPCATRWAYVATFVIDTAPVVLILAEARACARDYAQGIAFHAAGPDRMRRIAVGLAAFAVAPALGHGLVLLAGHGVDLDWLHASSLQALVLAACLLVLAEVGRIGHAIERDRDGFV